ncbi:hypothetical protein [Nannocystis radixulma]|uniref:Uncharacterized protein n=1 Tax=Nannocystis radixulma TaxID=2995305 RepID=A0ABT5B5G9_9BACT|nr:hypothetical protein [Nannocystis radixulma]MDC0669342.1 hypothetical protein [Nannocystis radixulma]
MILDVGTEQDVESPQPAGCKGKIDFLFVIAREAAILELQAKMVAAFPEFIATIEAKFADFDYHIMVVDADRPGEWGSMWCDQQCPLLEDTCAEINYPCDYIPTACDTTMGAGTTYNAGPNAANKPCELASGHRWIDKEQPDLSGTFTCLAQGGTNGGSWPGAALSAAVSSELTEAGACNEGFLRDDALLMVTIIASYDEPSNLGSPGKPAEWAQALLDAKHGDEDAVVMFSFGDLTCPPADRICDLVLWYFPYHHIADWNAADYGPGFDVATDLVETACSAFIPG